MPLDFILNQFSYFSYLFSSMVTNAVELQGHLDGRASGSNGELRDL